MGKNTNFIEFKEVHRLRDVDEMIDQQLSGSVELNMSALKRIKHSPYGKYSGAIFHVLDNINKSKPKYLKELNELNSNR